MTAILGRTGNLVGFSTGRGTTPWDTEMEAALRKMDAMLASTVVAITNTLPGSANEGDLYLVGTSPTGVAAGWANRVARWRSSPAGWEAYQPMQGWIITIVGESTNKVRRYNGTAWVALAADAGAEPYAGVPAQTSFWRSTAAGVRAWVQLVAADITDLATTLAGYLTKANPTFTGRLSGNDVKIGGGSTSGWLQLVASNSSASTFNVDFLGGASSNRRMTFRWSDSLDNLNIMTSNDDGSARLDRFLIPRSSALPIAVAGGFNVSSGDLSIGGTTAIDSSRNITGATVKGLNAAGIGTRPVVAGADGTFDDQDAATFLSTIGALAASLKGATNGVAELGADVKIPVAQLPSAALLALGETSATAYRGDRGKTAYDHSQATGNPHGTTAADITDLATTLAGYLTKANPEFTGTLTGPTATLSGSAQEALRLRRSGATLGQVHGVDFQGQTDNLTWVNYARLQARLASTANGAQTGSLRMLVYDAGVSKIALDASPSWVELGAGIGLSLNGAPAIDANRNGSLKSLTVDENIFLPNSVTWKSGSTNYFSMYATSLEFGIRDLNDAGSVIAYPLIVKRGVGGEVQIGYSGGLRPVRIGGVLKNDALAGAGNRPLVAGADGTIDDQDAATFRGTIGALAASLKGAANGVAELGADGKVPSAQLPSYVDDVLEYANFAALPATGETGKIYITQDNNKTWRWSGSAYVEISASLALGETSATAYRGDRGKTAYDHSQATGNPHGTTAADVGALASTNPEFTGALKQGGTTRIASGGGAWFASVQSTNLVGAGDRLVAADLTGTLQPKTPSQARSLIGAAKSPSKLNVSTSTTIGDIDASAIKVTTTDVILTLSGGVDGQGWDIINPTASTGIAIPSGATLWKSIGSDVGPTTIALGGGRPIRITRIDANTWTMLGSQ